MRAHPGSLAVLLTFVATPAAAQDMRAMHDSSSAYDHWQHAGAFYTRRAPTGCTLCGPSVDLNGGVYLVPRDALGNVREGFVRAHFQAGFPIPVLEASADLLWIPGQGATPTITGVLQAAPVPERIPLHLSVGLGAVTGRDGARDRLKPWAQAVLAYRSPVHEITPFVQIGRVVESDRDFEFLFGLAHPLFPWKAHLIP